MDMDVDCRKYFREKRLEVEIQSRQIAYFACYYCFCHFPLSSSLESFATGLNLYSIFLSILPYIDLIVLLSGGKFHFKKRKKLLEVKKKS